MGVIHEELSRLQAAGTPIRVGIVGAGPYGLWIGNQVSRTPGMELCIVADHTAEKAIAIYTKSGFSREDITVVDSTSKACDAISRGRRVVLTEGDLVPECSVDVVVDATGYPESGASIGYRTLMAGKHLVSVNSEADCLIGPILRRIADRVGSTYNLAAGDQPADGKELFNYVASLGLELVAIGLGHAHGNITEEPERMARALALKSRNKIASADGSKNQIEMCSIANAVGLPPDVRGMHHMVGSVRDIPQIFCPKKDGGILSQSGVVDYAKCNDRIQPHAVDVFAVVTSDNAVTLETMKDKGAPTSANGKYALLTRGIHLGGVETPWTIAGAFITRESSVAPQQSAVAEVVAVAKRALRAGEELDSVGGLTVRGVIERAEIAHRDNFLPLGLCQHVKLGRDIAEGSALTYADLAAEGTSFAWTLRRLQDAHNTTIG
jgi:predicted homoserine dehydrogenase-like protein